MQFDVRAWLKPSLVFEMQCSSRAVMREKEMRSAAVILRRCAAGERITGEAERTVRGRGGGAALGGKEAVLRLVGHGDAQVQKQALLASQKILLSRDKADFLANLDSGLAPSDDK